MIDFYSALSISSEAIAPYEGIVNIAGAIICIIAVSAIAHFLLHNFAIRSLERASQNSQKIWKRAILNNNLYGRSAIMLQCILFYWQVTFWLDEAFFAYDALHLILKIAMLFYGMLILFSHINILLDISNGSKIDHHLPLKGMAQTVKLIAVIVFIVMGISILIGKSPLILMSGLGAMTAIVMLVFKDPLLGLVAGIQLSANHMLKKNDWLQMDKYGADGSVIDIGLTTVKVQNWDKTITTIPTHALISDSFKNWRGMAEAGARRIKRSISIDISSIDFLTPDQQANLQASRYLGPHFNRKEIDLAEYAATNNLDSNASPLDMRALTNLGVFRAYTEAYLRFHPGIHQGMMLMVRQLPPTEHGQPIEIYCFTNTIEWAAYEGIQSDIFDHLYATLPSFGLRAYQAPSGSDFKRLT